MQKFILFSKNRISKGSGKTHLVKKNEGVCVVATFGSVDELEGIAKKFQVKSELVRKAERFGHSHIIAHTPFVFMYMDEILKNDRIKVVKNIIVLQKNVLLILSEDEYYLKYIDFIFPQLEKEVLKRRTESLLYSFFEFSIEENYDILKMIDKKVSMIQEELMDHKSIQHREMMELKHGLVTMSNSVWKFTQVVFTLKNNSLPIPMTKEDKLSVEEVYHSLHHQIEIILAQREMVTDLLSIQSTNISNNLNTIMKTLTAITVIISVPALITSLFDVNFRVLPLVNLQYGFPIMILIIGSIVFALYYYFYRKDWL